MRYYPFVLATLATLSLQEKVYDPSIAFRALYYSAAAYCDSRDVQTWSCGNACDQNSGLIDVENFNDTATNTFGYAGFDN
jgi:hypothetical protein